MGRDSEPVARREWSFVMHDALLLLRPLSAPPRYRGEVQCRPLMNDSDECEGFRGLYQSAGLGTRRLPCFRLLTNVVSMHPFSLAIDDRAERLLAPIYLGWHD